MITNHSVRLLAYLILLDEMKVNIKGCMIHEIEKDQYYLLYFDPLIYLQQNFSKEHQAILDLIRRKDSKDTIITGLYDMIKTQQPVKALKLIFSKLVSEYKSTLITDETLINNGVSKMNQDFEISNLHSFMTKKKMIIKPADICHDLFKFFLYDKKVEKQYIIELIIMYISCLQKERIKVHTGLVTILLGMLRKGDTMKYTFLPILLQFQSIPDTMELANFILNECEDDSRLLQFGLDILKRLKKHDQLVIELIKRGLIEEALMYVKQNKITLNNIPPEVIKKLQQLISEKKKLFVDFLAN